MFLHISESIYTFTPMEEQVTDISKVLHGITEEMRLLRETVNQQYAEIIKLNRNINALNLQIRKKDMELTNHGNAWPSMKTLIRTSNNSSTPQTRSV